jgi:hypothetical protein
MDTQKQSGCSDVPRRTFVHRAARFALALGFVLAGRPSTALGFTSRECSDPECQEMENICEAQGADWYGYCLSLPPGPNRDQCEQELDAYLDQCANDVACCCCHRVSEMCEFCE